MIKFEGKSLVLTGGSGGIGQATAKTFAAAGADVVLSDIDGKVCPRALKAGARKLSLFCRSLRT
jgi:NAD(P)-dependent dehydrogenase (short-subunit alcohol dehydrogenase family)